MTALHCRLSGAALEDVFRQLKGAFKSRAEAGDMQHIPYNVILTAEFMMVVPRSRETFGPVSVNSMGYAGSLFVRSQAELDFIKQEGPINILSEVGLPW
jgi:ATP adenylyltransferase